MSLSLASWYLGYSSHHPFINWEMKKKSSYRRIDRLQLLNPIYSLLLSTGFSQYIFLVESLLAQAFPYLQLSTEEEWNISPSVTHHTVFCHLFKSAWSLSIFNIFIEQKTPRIKKLPRGHNM